MRKKTSNTARGNRYKVKTRKWFEAQGYFVEYLEHVQSIFTPRGPIYRKTDCLGSDGLAMNGKEIIFWNSKATENQLEGRVNEMTRDGLAEFAKFPFPPFVKRKLIIWKLRAKEPIVVDAVV